jgi:hypothetical protein
VTYFNNGSGTVTAYVVCIGTPPSAPPVP